MNPGQASDTALIIARSLLLVDAAPALRPLLVPDSAELTRRLLAAAAPARWFDAALRWKWSRAALFAAERAVLPGIALHWFARKLLLNGIAGDALAAGCRQLVILGAGLDTLAWRVQRAHSACACFEVDHPATQAVKRRAFATEPAAEVPALVAADLALESVTNALDSTPRFDRHAPTLFVAEGLLMYLPVESVETLLRTAAAAAGPGSQFAFTFLEARPDQPLGFQGRSLSLHAWLRWRGEPFRWGLDRAHAADFTARQGWRLETMSTPDELRARFLAPHGLDRSPLAVGESVALASRVDL